MSASLELFKVLLFIYSLSSGDQIATLRFEQTYSREDCAAMVGPIAAQIRTKSILLLRQRVRVTGECVKGN